MTGCHRAARAAAILMLSGAALLVGRRPAWAQNPSTAQVLQAPEQPPEDLSDEASEGIGDVRVENEYKINIPDSIVEAVWAYLNRRYVPSPAWLQRPGEAFGSRASEEFFRDVYYDTPDEWFFRNDNGLRHRTRHIPGDVNNKKNGRELMQIKLQRPGDYATSRSEIKFAVRHYPPSRLRPDDSRPGLGIVKHSDRQAFVARLASMGVDANNIRPALTIDQRRRRVYIFDAKAIFFSFTLDQTSAKKWWMTDGFTEIELEINELVYTAASPEQRKRLEALQKDCFDDLNHQFPGLVVDQTPKYTKLTQRFSRDHAFFPIAFRLSLDPEAQAVIYSGVLIIAFGVFGFGAWRRSRVPQPAVIRDATQPEVHERFLHTSRS